MMSKDFATDYSFIKWLKSAYYELISWQRGNTHPSLHLINFIIFTLFGVFNILVFHKSLVAYLRISFMTYEEVSQTPFLPIWTSFRALTGFLFLFTAFMWLCLWVRARQKAAQTVDTTPQS